jgi:signal transduction histidine kinase
MKSSVTRILFLVIPDMILACVLFFFYYRFHSIHAENVDLIAGITALLVIARGIVFFIGSTLFYRRKVLAIREVISDFNKGRFIQPQREIKVFNELDLILKELLVAGRRLDSIVTSQKKDIDNFTEMYNSIIFSISSYFMVLGEDERVVFANDGFYKKFQFQRDEIYNKKIEDIFYFVNARLKGGIEQVKQSGLTAVLEKTHLLTLNKVSIIADIKISKIVAKDGNQIIIIIDDVSKKLRNDYQISLMSQITESIQKDDEIDRVLYTILTGVTSGNGLGFNRAILFLVEDAYLVGRMAVGPDSFEEAIEIWTAASSNESNQHDITPEVTTAGIHLLTKVLNTRFSLLKSKNLLTQAFINKENIHVADAWNDDRVSQEIREFMDVKEFLVIPLVVVNRAIGLITADNKFNNAPIMKENIELLSIFAAQAAMSIESYTNLDTLRSEMEKLSERQDAIIESEKLAAVGRIAANMAHEIRNPLVTMGGYARRIMQLSKDKSKIHKKIETSAEIILKECERLEKTLSNVMDFSRPPKFIKEFNNMNEIISDTVSLLKNIFQEKKIKVEMNLAEDIPLVKSDFNQMKQVMLNLIQNSIDATLPGGTIWIATGNGGDAIAITISVEDPNIVFEPFYSTKVSGVGLGLAIVKKIIKDHNGSIRFTNRDSGGAEFVIRLPLPG